MRVVNTDYLYHRNKSPEKYLQTADRDNKKNYLEAFLRKRRHSPPFTVSVDGLLGVEAEDMLKCIASCLMTKWKQPHSWTCGYINSRVAVNLIRATHRCIRGSWVQQKNISVQ